MNYTRMTMGEWDKVVEKSHTRFQKEILGERPTKQSVAATLHNPYTISILEWMGLALLIAIAVVTAFKMIAVAVPFAQSFFNNETAPIIVNAFAVAMSVTFILFSTSGLIYYKLMDDFSVEIAQQKHKNNRLIFMGGWKGAILTAIIAYGLTSFALSFEPNFAYLVTGITFLVSWYLGGLPINFIQYISPRLYLILTYFTAVWLFVISSAGDGTFFERYGIVIAEVALAYLVANLIEKNAKWSQAVHDAWVERTKPYDNRLENYWNDGKFLPILYRELREFLMHIERQHPEKVNKKYRPNYRVFAEGEQSMIDRIIIEEYHRHTAGLRFAKELEQPTEKTAEPQPKILQPGKRIPPIGDTHWTVESLIQDFIIRGLKPNADYSEGNVRQDYEPLYEARTAFRNGARDYFTSNRV